MLLDIVILCCLGLFSEQITGTMMGQLNWTPVFVGGNNQIDMWTKESKGCECQFNISRNDCACCVKPGGCQCGSSAPSKCAQCGLQQYCNNMCNVTIIQRAIFAESKSTVGQIKSPSLQGPALCWYLLQPEPGHRLEIQIYRLINVGRFNGTGCQSGYVHLVDESSAKFGSTGVHICGENERFAPPVVLFSDEGAATLTFRIEEATTRSQFLAHYSFTSFNNTQGVGFRPNGGKRIEHTSCDWLYQDFTCVTEPNGCILASPGYPGIYPSRSTCRYHITMSSLRTKVKIVFTTLSLPFNRCATDYINVYQGPTSGSSLLTTLCSNKKQELVYSGPNLLLEFKSGVSVPPYDYNGFVARLDFVDKLTTTELPSSVSHFINAVPNKVINSSEKSIHRGLNVAQTLHSSDFSNFSRPENCIIRIHGNMSRSGHFDTRTLPIHCSNSTLIFIGQENDLVHISLFNYRLNASYCQSFIEIIDGNIKADLFKLVLKICSPKMKFARNAEGRFHEQQTFLSSGQYLSIHFERKNVSSPPSEVEYIDGAFSFLDEYADGTVQPDTLCDVAYYGLKSSSSGRIRNHGSQYLFWNVDGSLRCSQRFIPVTNQSVILKITSLQRLTSDMCHTRCGDSGCQCVLSSKAPQESFKLVEHDHLLILDKQNVSLSCICGPFKEEWLPIIIRSWSPITVVYSVAKYSWAEKGFSFEAEYKFEFDNVCGYQVINHHLGMIQPMYMPEEKVLNYYYNQDCAWLLNSNIERQLQIDIKSSQNRPCSAWNISLLEYVEKAGHDTGRSLYQFCSRDVKQTYDLPWKLNVVIIKLKAMTRTLPQFQIKWRSQIIQKANTGLSVLTPEASNAASSLIHIVSVSIFVIFCNFYTFVHNLNIVLI